MRAWKRVIAVGTERMGRDVVKVVSSGLWYWLAVEERREGRSQSWLQDFECG